MRAPSKLILSLALYLSHTAIGADMIENISAYHNNSKWQKLSAQETFELFYSKYSLKGDEHLLDICSGDGKVSHYFAEKLPHGHVVGIDTSKSMVKFAKNHYGEQTLSFRNMDAQSLAYRNEFDVITSFTCLHLVPDIPATFRGMERSLKPDGKILLQFPYDHGLNHAIETVKNSPRWQPYFHNFKAPWYFLHPETYKTHMIEAKLKPLRVEITQMHEVYVSRGEFQASVAHWLPHLKHLAEPLRDEFMEELINCYLTYMPADEQGYVHYYVDRIEIEAIKPAPLSV